MSLLTLPPPLQRQTPLTALRVTSLMNEAGVPKGVFNLVHSPPLLDALSLGGND